MCKSYASLVLTVTSLSSWVMYSGICHLSDGGTLTLSWSTETYLFVVIEKHEPRLYSATDAFPCWSISSPRRWPGAFHRRPCPVPPF